ncbi:ABC transporter permease subunit [Lutibacter sp. B2]|nr:ABC transporter permease subunit [Lutibacter sp. B2]
MNLKTLFNKNLIKKDLKIVKWLIVIATIILFVCVPMQNITYLNEITYLDPASSEYDYNEEIHDMGWIITQTLEHLSDNPIQAIVVVLIPIAVAVVLMGGERRQKTLDLLHVMPYTKEQIYINKIITGMIAIITPYLINMIITFIMRATITGLEGVYSYTLILEWALNSMVLALLYFSFTILMGTIFGNSSAQIVLTVIFMIFPYGFTGLLAWNVRMLNIGRLYYAFDPVLHTMQLFTLPFYIDPYGVWPFSLTTIKYIPIFLTVSMLIGGYILFKKNKMERNGEVLLFSKMETFFKFGVSRCTMLLFGALFVQIVGSIGFIVGYPMGIIVGWIVPKYFIGLSKAGR